MTPRQKKSRIRYFTVLGIYVIVLLILGFLGLRLLWSYAKEYEASQIDKVLISYMEEINSEKWNPSMQAAADKLTNAFQDASDVEAVVKDYLSKGMITYTIATGGIGIDDTKTYDLACNGKEIGSVTFRQDTGKNTKFNMYPWLVESDSFDFEFLKTGTDTVTVPESYTLQINGRDVGEEYIVETGIKYDILEKFYADYKDLPTKVRYEVTELVGDFRNTILDEDGKEFTPDATKGDIQYLKPCPDAETQKIAAFMDEFIEAYKKFFGTKWVDSTYPTLQPYLMRDTDLWNTCYEYTLDAATWIKTFNVDFQSKQFNYAFALGGGFYVASESCHTVAYAEYKTVDEESEDVFVLYDDPEEGLKVVSVA